MTVFSKEAQGTASRGVPVNPLFFFNPFPEQDYIEALVGCIRKVLPLRNRDIQRKAIAQLNAKISNHALVVLPSSHEWSDLNNRLLFFRYYAEGLNQMGDGNSSEDELIKKIIEMEIQYEKKSNSHYRAYQDLTAKLYGKKFRAPDPPPLEKQPEMDEETKAIIEKHKVNEKLQLYIKSRSYGKAQNDNAYSTLVSAYIETLSDLAIPLSLEYQDQQKRAEDHNWIEWMQANHFPWQHEKLFPVLYTLLQQARDYLKTEQIDNAEERLELAQTLYDRLATLMYDYYSGKVKKGTRVIVVLMVLKSISRMMLSIVVFKNVKGVVSQFAALIAVNLVYQQLDQTIGVRDRGLSGKDAVKDAALELLMVKITAKISQLLATRFMVDPKSLSFDVMNTLAGTVIGSMEEEFMKLGRGVTFVGFLKNLRAKFTNPEFWVENIVIAVLARNYRPTAKETAFLDGISSAINKNVARVAVPLKKHVARATTIATIGTVLTLSPKASADNASNKPSVMDVVPQNATPGSTTAKTATTKPPAQATSSPAVQTTAARSTTSTAITQGAPTQQQRAVANATFSPDMDPATPTKSPLTPLSSSPLLGMAVVVSKNSKRGKMLKLFQDAKKLLDKIDDQDLKKKCEERLDDLRKEYDKNNDHVETKKKMQAIKNKINEIFAEEQINFLLEHNLPAFGIKRIISKVAVPRRGSNGPEIIDMVYKVETMDGKIAFLALESKYGGSRLGWVQYGKIQVRQFSPEWFEMRIDEIRLQDASFAKELSDGWKKGAILPFVLKIRSDGSPKGFVDYTAEWTKYLQPTKKKP